MDPQQQQIVTPQPSVQAQTPPIYDYALGRRILALFIDLGIAAYLPFIIIALVIGAMGAEIPSNELVRGSIGLLYILYATFLEATSGQTFGKKVMKIRVIGTDGKVCTTKQAIIRNLGRILDGMIFIVTVLLILFTKRKQRVGDILAGTMVVKI